MDMEGTTLNEISQMGKTNIVWYHLYVESKKYNYWIKQKKEAVLQMLVVELGVGGVVG